jgi:hypothetical protein
VFITIYSILRVIPIHSTSQLLLDQYSSLCILTRFSLSDNGSSPLPLNDLADAVPCIVSFCLRIDDFFDIPIQVGAAFLGLLDPGSTITEHDIDILNNLTSSLERRVNKIASM